MSDFIYNPRDTFLAHCWWQGSDLATIWAQTGSLGAKGYWDRYLQSEPDGVLEKRLEPSMYVAPNQRYYELFWFGAYTQGSYDEDKALYYEIRPVDRTWAIYNWVLDYSLSIFSSQSGFVGLWQTSEHAGTERLPSGARLWSIEGLPRQGLKAGDRPANLRLIAHGGYPVRRYDSEGFPGFHVRWGEPGLMTMEIESLPHNYGEI